MLILINIILIYAHMLIKYKSLNIFGDSSVPCQNITVQIIPKKDQDHISPCNVKCYRKLENQPHCDRI